MKDAGEGDEIWFPIPIGRWQLLYEASSKGRIRRVAKVLPPRNINGYDVVTLSDHGNRTTVGVHRLIAAAFIRPPEDGEVVNHKNAERRDNRVENLEWTTPAGNNAHTAMLGRMSSYPEHHNCKIEPEMAFEMRRNAYSYSKIAERFGCSIAAVSAFFKKARKKGVWTED